MGRDKATLVVRGETLAAHGARVLGAVCDPVVEAGPGVSGLRAVLEEPAGSGPLAALAAALDLLGGPDCVVVLACDLPNVTPAVLELVATWPGRSAVVPVAGGRLQYACARWPASSVRAARARGAASLAALLDTGIVGGEGDRAEPATFLDERVWGSVAAADTFHDVDTPDDLDRMGPLGPPRPG